MASVSDCGDAVHVGTFRCESGTLRVTDPCYEPGTWCAGSIGDCRTGEWAAVITRQDYGDWGRRVRRLTVAHTDGGTGDEQQAKFEVGVDSGQAGVFDAAQFTTRDYDRWCRLSNPAGAQRHGVVSSSGFGDGGYACTYRRDADGKCFEISITFIDEEE